MKMVMVTCPERANWLEDTLASLHRSDWTGEVEIVVDNAMGKPSTARIRETWKRAISIPADVWCEDDIVFGRYFMHNLIAESVGMAPLGYRALYHPDFDNREVYGCQAVTMTEPARVLILDTWRDDAPADIEMPRAVKRAAGDVSYARKSLVDHIGESTYGGPKHRALDFDREWKAP
jgi:hypothetical protein